MSGTAQEEPYSLTFVANNLGIEGAAFNIGESRQSYDATDFGDSITPVVFTLTSAEGMEFTATDQVAVDIGESQLGLPESQFSVVTELIMENSMPTGDIRLTISGTYPSLEGHHIVDVNVAATAALDALSQAREDALDDLASQVAATSGTFDASVSQIPGAGGTVTVNVSANGRWYVAPRGRTSSGDVIVDGGVVGNYAPTNGGAANQAVSITTGPLSSFTNGDSIISSSWELVLYSSDDTELDSVTVTQSSTVGPETRFVSTLPANQIASVLYITPQ